MYDECDEFTKSYIIAALWSTNDESTPEGGEPMDKNYGPEDLAPATFEQMKADCAKFQAEFGHLINDETCLKYEDSPESQAGHDFWLTRVGAGVGFWETSDWEKEAGKILTAGAKAYGTTDLCIGDDGKIY